MARLFDDVLIGSIELFCAAAEVGSFTGAAVATGVTPAAISRSISRLEARLGVRLFVRTTRSIRLTDEGQVYFEQCRQALNQLADAERFVTGRQKAPAGLLRISMPTPYGHFRVLPLLSLFRSRYPDVQIEVHLSNRNIDFSEEGYDLAIRGRTPADSTMIARKLEDSELVVVATPEYLKRAGTPRTPAHLADHDCIQYLLPSSGRVIPWLFRDKGKDVELTTKGGYSCGEDILGCVTLALNNAGLFQTYRFIVDKDIKQGKLIEVLRPYGGRSRPFTLLYPHSRHISLRVRTFVDFLIEQLGGSQTLKLAPGNKPDTSRAKRKVQPR